MSDDEEEHVSGGGGGDDDDDDEQDGDYEEEQNNKKTPKRNKNKRKTPEGGGNKTPGKKKEGPLNEMLLSTLKARLKAIKDKKEPKLQQRAEKHKENMDKLKGMFFSQFFHQLNTNKRTFTEADKTSFNIVSKLKADLDKHFSKHPQSAETSSLIAGSLSTYALSLDPNDGDYAKVKKEKEELIAELKRREDDTKFEQLKKMYPNASAKKIRKKMQEMMEEEDEEAE